MKSTLILTSLLLLLVAQPARAGLKTSGGMFMSVQSRMAAGAIGEVRNNPNDTVSYLGCMTFSPNNGPRSANCYASRATDFIACATTLPALVTAVDSIKGDSYLAFGSDANGNCTFIEVINESQYEPKQ